MATNSFGTIFRFTTWGESHGKAIGVVIDGCPAGLPLTDEDIQAELALRAPGKTPFTSPRQEKDRAEILSGVFEGRTTGAPISIIMYNKDADSSKYEPIKDVLRPGHANYTYLKKYGIFDYRGGGRSSARETASRVAAGAVAKKLLQHVGIEILAYIVQIGQTAAHVDLSTLSRQAIYDNLVFCPDDIAAQGMMREIEQAKMEGDSLGGVIEFCAHPVPVGLGDPVYEKLEANLAKAMLSIHATKGFEIGSGFQAAGMKGSQHNDVFIAQGDRVVTQTNYAGGALGGISSGMPVVGRVGFKPTSSIEKPQASINLEGQQTEFILPKGSRHDPCVAIRAVPVVEAMAALVIADAYLLNRVAKL